MLTINEVIERFWDVWPSSPAAQLLVPKRDVNIYLGPDEYNFAAIALCANEKCTLKRLDELVTYFEIPQKGTDNFKRRLEENWLAETREKRRDVTNQTTAALAELVVANYLKCNCYIITNLAAWSNASSDIECENDGRRYIVEVKLLPESPELYSLRTTEVGGDLPGDGETLNYFFSRVADAVKQLANRNVPHAERMVWLIFDAFVEEMYGGRKTFDRFWSSHTNWYRIDGSSHVKWYSNSSGVYPGISVREEGDNQKEIKKKTKRAKRILAKSPQGWIKEAGRLMIATMDSWRLERISEIHWK